MPIRLIVTGHQTLHAPVGARGINALRDAPQVEPDTP